MESVTTHWQVQMEKNHAMVRLDGHILVPPPVVPWERLPNLEWVRVLLLECYNWPLKLRRSGDQVD